MSKKLKWLVKTTHSAPGLDWGLQPFIGRDRESALIDDKKNLEEISTVAAGDECKDRWGLRQKVVAVCGVWWLQARRTSGPNVVVVYVLPLDERSEGGEGLRLSFAVCNESEESRRLGLKVAEVGGKRRKRGEDLGCDRLLLRVVVSDGSGGQTEARAERFWGWRLAIGADEEQKWRRNLICLEVCDEYREGLCWYQRLIWSVLRDGCGEDCCWDWRWMRWVARDECGDRCCWGWRLIW